MSKIEAGNIYIEEHDCELYAIVSEIQDMIALRAQAKQLDLRVAMAPQVPNYIQTDEKKLRQLLINFLNNAIKYTEVGHVSLTVDYQQAGSSLVFTISDSGIGISPSELADIFQPFVQVSHQDRIRDGVGLGLAISQNLIEKMGGHLTVQSTLGQGSTFNFVLPVKVRENPAVGSKKRPKRVIGLASNQPLCKVLIVDDDANNRQLLAHYLQPIGFEVQVATQGQEALEISANWYPHVVLMDMRMPVMNGYEATQHLKHLSQTWGHQPVVLAVTASAFEEEREKILAAGCDAFLRKPVTEQEILTAIGQYANVSYRYAETLASVSDDIVISPLIEWSVLPLELRQQLKQATELGHMELIYEAIHTMAPKYPDLARILEKWANQFEYDKIFDVLNEMN